jgi:hypothetical protein
MVSHLVPESFEHSFDQLHDAVIAETGFDQFGPADYHEGLRVLLESMDRDPQFSVAGRQRAWAMVRKTLAARAIAIDSMARNPLFSEVQVTAPVVIFGLPRSGTTALHRLLMEDPAFQGLEAWLLDSPMPRPSREAWSAHPAFQSMVAELEARYALTPDKKVAHEVIADQVHECCMLLRQSFASNILSCAWSAPTYDTWWQDCDEQAAYGHYHRCVQVIGLNDQRRWLLKNPGHVHQLDLLLDRFPDACLIQCHRDPAAAVPSLCSLLMRSHPTWEDSDPNDRAGRMVRREVEKWALGVERAALVRAERCPSVLDIHHSDFHSDPWGVVRKIYQHIGMPLSDVARRNIAHRLEQKPELAQGPHHYAVSDFNISASEIRERFSSYLKHYDIEPIGGLA